MKKYIDKLSAFIDVLAFISLAAMLTVVSIQVITRYTVFLRVPRWTEELSRYAMIYTVGIASGIAVRRKAYLGMDSLYMLFPFRLKKVITVIFNILTAILFTILVTNGIEVVESSMIQRSPSLRFSMAYIYFILPLTGANVVLFLIFDTIETIQAFILGEPVKEEDKETSVTLT